MTTPATPTTPAGNGDPVNPSDTDSQSNAPTDGGGTTTEPKGDSRGSALTAAQKPTADAGEGEVVISLPEGTQVDETSLKEFTSLAKELGLNSEKATKVMGLYLKQQQSQIDALVAQDEKWDAELRGDPDFGGEKYDANAKITQKVVAKLGGQPLIDLIDQYQLGNNPVLAKAFWRARSIVSEDSSAGDKGAPTPSGTSEQERLRRDYPSMYNDDGTPVQ